MGKKLLRLALCLGALAAAMTSQAFATDYTANDAGTVTFDPDAVRYTASYSQAVANEEYALLVVKGAKTEDSYQYSVTSDNILYIDQKAADADGNITFSFIPKQASDSVVLLGGQFEDGQSPKVLGMVLGIQTLDAPTISATNNTTTGKPVISWSAVEGAAKYELHRSADGGETYTLLTTTTKLKITNTSAEAGVTYYYKVRALDENGKEGKFSEAKSRACDYATPVVTVALNDKGKPVLTWDAVTNATSYEVSRSTTEDGAYTVLKTVTGTKLTNSSAVDGTTYYYKVRALGDNAASASAYSAVVSIKAGAQTLEAPTLTATNNTTSGKPILSWTAVEDAAKYELYRSTDGETYTKLTTTSGTKITNSSAVAGTTYYYKVRALDADGNAGEYSAAKSRACDYARPVVEVTLSSKGKPVLTWDAVTNATSYKVYRSTDGETFSLLTTVTGTKVTNSSAVSGTTYYYKIRAYGDNSSSTSSYSAVVSIKAGVQTLEAPTLTATNNTTSGKPVLSWTAVDGAAKYELYRSADGETYTKLTTTTGTKITNSSAVAGTTYYYKVRALDADGNAGEYSAAKSRACDYARPVVEVTLSSKGKPVLTWDAVTNATSYKVYRSTDGETFSLLTTVTGTKVTNSSAVSGTTYYYKVRAYGDNSSSTSSYSAVVSATAG